jgi:arsenate reductase-like glutaredoxin family protein
MNPEDPDFIQNFNRISELSVPDWLTLLIHNPQILKAKIVMKGDSISIMSNPQDILHFVK